MLPETPATPFGTAGWNGGLERRGIKDFFESDLDELERYIKALQSDQ